MVPAPPVRRIGHLKVRSEGGSAAARHDLIASSTTIFDDPSVERLAEPRQPKPSSRAARPEASLLRGRSQSLVASAPLSVFESTAELVSRPCRTGCEREPERLLLSIGTSDGIMLEVEAGPAGQDGGTGRRSRSSCARLRLPLFRRRQFSSREVPHRCRPSIASRRDFRLAEYPPRVHACGRWPHVYPSS